MTRPTTSHVTLILILTAFFIGCRPAPEQHGERSTTTTAPHKFAVLVGVNGYENAGSLLYAENDVEAISHQLMEIGFKKEDIVCLSGSGLKRPTKDKIEYEIGNVLKTAGINDVIFIILCGHGIELDEEQKPRFCPSDAKTDNLENAKKTTVLIEDVYSRLAQHPSRFKLMVVDACRNNPFRGERTPNVKGIRGLEFPPLGCALLQSCSPGQFSLEDHELKQGIFSHFLVEGLSGKAANESGTVTLGSLTDYVTGETQKWVQTQVGLGRFQEGIRQEPRFIGDYSALVLVEGPFAPPIGEVKGQESDQANADNVDPAPPIAEVNGKESGISMTATPKNDLILKGPDGRELKMSEWQSLANNSDPAACVVVGVWHSRGEYGIPQDDKEACKLFRKAAELGNPDGCFNLGLNYFNGWGVPKDEGEAVKWWRKAAENNHTAAQSTLGAFYFKQLNFEEAEEYLVPAAKKKDAQAQYFLGAGYLSQVYTKGRYNADEDEEYGFQLLIESMKQGNNNASQMLELHKDNGNLSRLLRGIPPLFGNEL